MAIAGYEEVSPFEPGSKDDLDYQRTKWRGPLLAASQILPTWAAGVLPIGKSEQGDIGIRPPGLISGAYGALGALLPDVASGLAQRAGYNINIGHAPGADTAARWAGDNARLMQDVVPQVQPQNEDEQHVADFASGIAALSMPGGGAVAKAPSGIARLLGHVLLPNAPKTAAVMTGGLQGYQDLERDDRLRMFGLDPRIDKQIRDLEQAGQPVPPELLQQLDTFKHDLTAPDTTHDVASPQAGAAATVPFPISSTSSATQPTGDDTAPRFDSTGRTEIPWWAVAAGGAGLTVAAPYLMRYGGRVFDPMIKFSTGRMAEIDNAANVAKFNQNLDAVDSGRVLGSQPGAPPSAVRGEAPLPTRSDYGARAAPGSAMTNLAQAGWDKNRVVTEINKATAPSRLIAEQMQADLGTTLHSTPLMNKITEQMATGVNLENGGKLLPKLKGIAQKIDALDDTQKAKLENGLYAGDELDTRQIKFGQVRAKGDNIADDTLFRHNFTAAHSADLRDAHRLMMADFQTAEIANQVYALQRANIEHGVDMGRITPQGARDILRTRPRQIPSTNVEGLVEHALSERNIDVQGWHTPPTRAIDALTQHYAKLYAEYAINRTQDRLIRQVETWQNAGPDRARIVTKLSPDVKPVPSNEARRITVHRNGVPVTYEIDNTAFHRALKGTQAHANMYIGAADLVRRSMQSGTTGLAATAIGMRPFALIQLNRGIVQIATDRTPGTKFGLVDRGLQYMTGGRVGSRVGFDPTQWIGSYNEALKGAAMVSQRYWADMLRRPTNPITALLTEMKGEAWVKAAADATEARYHASNAGQRRAEGAAGAGGQGLYDRPVFNIMRSGKPGYSPLAEAVPGVFHPDNLRIPFTHWRVPGTKGTMQAFINIRTLAREIHQEISEGGNSYYWKQLRDDPTISRERRVYETRRVIGDPTMSGASPMMQDLAHEIPYLNPSIQDAVRMMRNLRDNPVAFALGTAQTLVVAAVGSILSAMLGGAKHVNMLSNLMSTHERASNVVFFHNGEDEHDYSAFSLPQRLRMFYPGILQFTADALGIYQMHEGEDEYNRMIHTLSDLFHTSVTHSTVVATREGVGDFIDVIQAPPLWQAAAAVTGHQFQPPITTMMQNAAEGQQLTKGMITETNRPDTMPGRNQGSAFVSNDDAKWAYNILRAVTGMAADSYLYAHNAYERFNLRHDIADAFDGFMADAGQTWRDRAPFGNFIWGNNVKLSTRNPIEEANREAWTKMQAIGNATDIQAEGLTRRGGVPVSLSEQPQINPDPMIVQMMKIIGNYRSRISATIEPKINDLAAQIKDVNENKFMPSDFKREQANRLTAQKNEAEARKSDMINRLNATLSELSGGKRVDVRTFDQSKDRSQFHD